MLSTLVGTKGNKMNKIVDSCPGKLSLILCDELDGWDDGIGRRLREEGTYVYKWLIDYME